jgi:hypothetical protein
MSLNVVSSRVTSRSWSPVQNVRNEFQNPPYSACHFCFAAVAAFLSTSPRALTMISGEALL